MSTTGHENEVVRVSGLKATMRKGGNLGIFNKGTCSTAAATADKEVTVGDGFSLVNDAMILVTFQNAVSAADATLRVNSAVDDQDEPIRKPIRYRGAALASGMVKAGDAVMMRYHTDGSDSANDCWNIIGTLDSDTVTDVAYDTTNKKLTKTINGNTTDVATARKIVVDGGASVLLDIEQLASDYVFQPGDAMIVNGVLYRCTSATENTPLTLLVQDGKLLYVSINGQKCYMVSSNTVNAGWEKVTDLDDKYYIEQRLATEKADINALTKTQIEALTRHTRLTDFDLSVLKQAVADQNLEKYGLKVGDQKTINGHTYVIAGLNPMKGTHAYTCTSNHVGLIVIPHTTQKWNASGNTYTGADSRGPGYINSDLHYYLKNTLLPLVQTDLGSGNLLTHYKLLSSAVNQDSYNKSGWTTGCSGGWTWENGYIAALSEMQVYGGTVCSSSYFDTGEADQQLEVFKHYKHTEIFGDEYPWLRDMVSQSSVAAAHYDGSVATYNAASACSVAALVLFH